MGTRPSYWGVIYFHIVSKIKECRMMWVFNFPDRIFNLTAWWWSTIPQLSSSFHHEEKPRECNSYISQVFIKFQLWPKTCVMTRVVGCEKKVYLRGISTCCNAVNLPTFPRRWLARLTLKLCHSLSGYLWYLSVLRRSQWTMYPLSSWLQRTLESGRENHSRLSLTNL